jgi:hypothetical protein
MNKKIALMVMLFGVSCLAGCGGGGGGGGSSDEDDVLSELTRLHFSVDDEDITNRAVTYNVSAGEGVTINADVVGGNGAVGATWSFQFRDAYTGGLPRTTSRNAVVRPTSGKIVVVGKPNRSTVINGVETISGTTTVNVVVE